MAVSSTNSIELASGSWGGPVLPFVSDQIHAREKLFAKEYKTAKELLFLNGRTAWISLRSGVDIDGGPGLAKRYALLGGTVTNGEARKHLGLLEGELGTYSTSRDYGTRPMPGITGLTVSVKDDLGSIQEAEVKVVVHSKNDLESLERIFFCPGLPVLLEWGHTIYLTSDGKVQEGSAAGMMIPDEEVYREQTLIEMEQKISERENRFDGNYCGAVGYLSNYSYSFTKTGTWECTVKILSKGDLLARIKASRAEGDKNPEGKEEQEENVGDNRLIQVCALLSRNQRLPLKESSFTVGKKEKTLESRKGEIAEYITTRPYFEYSQSNLFEYKSGIISGWEATKGFGFSSSWEGPDFDQGGIYTVQVAVRRKGIFKDPLYLTYIQLRDLLHLFNCEIERRQEGIPVKFDLFSTQQYRTFQEHFSLNPATAVLPKYPSKINAVGEDKLKAALIPDKGKYEKVFQRVDTKGNNILDIYVSTEEIMKAAQTVITGGDRDYKILDILKQILRGIQKALGNINDFKVVFYPNTSWAYIIDSYQIEVASYIEESPEIIVSGPGTTVTDLEVKSEVSPEMSTMISVASLSEIGNEQGSSRDANLYWWAKGRKPRWIVPGGSKVASTGGEELAKINVNGKALASINGQSFVVFLEKLSKVYRGLTANKNKIADRNEDNFDPINDWVNQEVADVQLTGEDIFKKCMSAISDDITQTSSDGVIPVTLGLEMVGVGGFTMGTSFRVSPGILPTVYDDWGYIITGVSHEVGKNGWFTKLKTQYFPTVQSKAQVKLSSSSTNTTTSIPEHVESPISARKEEEE